MNIKFPRELDIDYVRIVIGGEGTHTENVNDERVYLLFAGYRKHHHNETEKIWMKAKIPFKFTVVGGKRPSAINLHHNNAYGFMTMLATKPKGLHLDFWYDNASTLTTDRGLVCQSLIVSSGKNQIELDTLAKKTDSEQFSEYFSVGMVNLDRNYPKFSNLESSTIELEVTGFEQTAYHQITPR